MHVELGVVLVRADRGGGRRILGADPLGQLRVVGLGIVVLQVETRESVELDLPLAGLDDETLRLGGSCLGSGFGSWVWRINIAATAVRISIMSSLAGFRV